MRNEALASVFGSGRAERRFGVMITIVLLIVGVPNARCGAWPRCSCDRSGDRVCLSALPPILPRRRWTRMSAVIVTAAAFLAGELVFGTFWSPCCWGGQRHVAVRDPHSQRRSGARLGPSAYSGGAAVNVSRRARSEFSKI